MDNEKLSFEDLMRRLNEQAIRNASALSPDFAASVAAERKEIQDHEKMLDAQHAKKQEPQPLIENRKPPTDPDEPSEKEILALVNKACVERHDL